MTLDLHVKRTYVECDKFAVKFAVKVEALTLMDSNKTKNAAPMDLD